MITNEDITTKQIEFEKIRTNPSDEIKKINNDWKSFLNIFSRDKIKNLKLQEYVLGIEETYKDSFCYWIENKLNNLGNIHGATSFKFGIYYGKTDSDPTLKFRWTKKFGREDSSSEEVFKRIKIQILGLLESGDKNNFSAIKENLLSPMFKGKILFLYYPHKFLNIFSEDHLNYFLNELSISYEDDLNEIDKRSILINYKDNDPIMKSWTNQDFSRFLYLFFRPPKNIRHIEIDFDKQNLKEQEEILKKTKNINREEMIEYLKSASPKETIIPSKIKSYKRDNIAIAYLKKLRDFKCQLCGAFILKRNGEHYIEGAHVDPKHNKGSELAENIIILCPNHHKEFDLGNRKIHYRSKDRIRFELNNKLYELNLSI